MIKAGDFIKVSCDKTIKCWPLLYFFRDGDSGNVYVLDLDWEPSLHEGYYFSWETIYQHPGLTFVSSFWQ